MKITPFRLASGLGVLALVVGTLALISSRSQVQSSQVPTIKIDGSSTVYPITKVFGGEAQLNLTLGELLRKQATF
ncbi:MAG: hypothetical protein M3O33_04375 [Cyanobacteriota bacterium]|nr:hypothetical protein [Cyanobacteriota bacterium]